MPNAILNKRCGGGAFTPRSLSGLILWVKTDAGLFQDSALTTPAVADADPVGGWVDQSGQGNNLLQATAGNRPTLKLAIQNGRAVLRFLAATQQYMDTTNISLPIPASAVFVGTDTVTNGRLTDSVSVINRRMITRDGSGFLTVNNSTSVTTTGSNMSTFAFNAGVWNGASSIGQQDGVVVTGSTSAGDALGIRVGGASNNANYLTGDIGEIIYYNRALTTGELDRLRSYVRSRWATA